MQEWQGGTFSMIVVFGSLNVDMVMAVPSLPRPGETVLAPSYQLVAGGKGANQALAAARAGAAVKFYGKIGGDDFAAIALGALGEAGVDLTGVGTGARATGCAVVCVDPKGENQIAVASGANLEAGAAQVPDEVLSPGATLVLQLEVAHPETAALVERARARGCRIILNAAPANPLGPETLAALDILVVNRIEAAMLAEAVGLPSDSPIESIRALAGQFGLTAVITMGEAGAQAFAAEGALAVDALAITPVDTTAAGDAFVGVLAAAIDSGEGLAEALRRASVAGGLASLEAGAQPSLPGLAAIKARLGEIAPPRPI